MQNKVSYEYETMGNSSYLVATLNKDVSLINYQMQMLSNNNINNILQANKRQKNDDVQIFYNITSKISLTQATKRGKIPKQGFLNLISGIIAAYREIAEYQLVDSGFVFDSDNIFIKTGTYEPNLVYLPITTEEIGIEPLKIFLLGLIAKSKVEITTDNFIQVILEALNSETLTIDELQEIVNTYSNKESVNKESKENIFKKDFSKDERNNAKVDIDSSSVYEKPQKKRPENNISIPEKKIVISQEKIGKSSLETIQQNNKKDTKNLFLLLQFIFLGVIVGCSFTGILNDDNGNIDLINLFAVIIVVAAVDFILYRQMFNNVASSENNNIKAKNKKEKITTSHSNIPIPGRDNSGDFKNNSFDAKQRNVQVSRKTIENPMLTPSFELAPEPNYVHNYDYDEFGVENTDVLVNNIENSPYLEFYDNGLLYKIKLEKESILVGKLKSQVDYVIKNTKVSKIHAEFICRNNEYFVKDYNSTNGTYINGSNQRIASNIEQQIYHGDKIILANVELTLKIN